MIPKTFTVPLSHNPDDTLVLGYEDDDYSDNGYWGHDNGTQNQCKYEGPAWASIHVQHKPLQPEANTDRPGGDYSNLSLSQARPELCAAACAEDLNCNSYTYVQPGIQGPQARCYLKWTVPAPVPNACCTSGLADHHEYGMNRPGSDLRRIELNRADPNLCSAECGKDVNCRSYTYVNPGQQSGAPACYLKWAVPPEVEDACCVSGVKPPNPWAVPVLPRPW
jgi:hypothetical protein